MGTRIDTREKILTLDEIRRRTAGRDVVWVAGAFDPLLAWHGREVGRRRREGAALAVVIEEPEGALMGARARAELVAALGAVDYVCVGEAAPEGAVRIEEEAARAGFLERVRARHGG